MVHVFLLRQGETTENCVGNHDRGLTDAKLTEKVLAQAEHLANALQGIKIDAVYASPLERAYRTAEIACGNRLPVVRDPRLIELDFGAWEGKTRAEFVAEDPALWEAWNDDPATAPAGGTGDTDRKSVV